MIYIIYPCPVSFPPLGFIFPLDSFCPRFILAPWKLLNDLHHIPVSHIIFPPPWIHFAPPPLLFCPLEIV